MASSLTNGSLYRAIRSNRPELMSQVTSDNTRDFLLKHVMQMINFNSEPKNEESEKNETILNNRIRGFVNTLNKKWTQCRSVAERFEQKNSDWLEQSFNTTLPQKTVEATTSSGERRGRPKISNFEEASGRTKRRRTESIRQSVEPETLYQATIHSLKADRKKSAAYIVAQATQFSPKRPLRIRRFFEGKDRKDPTRLSNEQALAAYVDLELTRRKYDKLRKMSKNQNADIFPPYNCVLEAKKKCYPENVDVGEYGMSIPLQELLNHTCVRICETLTLSQDEQLDNFSTVTLYSKWGCDGTSGQNEYMQLFPKEDADATRASPDDDEDDAFQFSEKNLFMFSVVPLRVVGVTEQDEKVLLWENPRPSSTRFCRPLKCLYIKETVESTNEEVAKVEAEIDALKPSKVEVEGKELDIRHQLILTMLDTKVINALTDTSSQRCYICGCLPSQMNNLETARNLSVRENYLKYGLSTLHAWIKFLECVLHILYKLEYNKTSLRGASKEKREEIETRKSLVQDELWKQIGIRVDKVVPGNGTSNTGNVARRFFANAEKASQATGVSEELIKKFFTILQVLSSGHLIDYEKFDSYAFETAELYCQLYGWYQMPPSVHKILIHGSQAVKYAILPIGLLSEEAQEARNKDYSRLRKTNTAKISRLRTSKDLIITLLISSDPVISTCRPLPQKKEKQLTTEALSLLKLEEKVEDKDEEEDQEMVKESDTEDEEMDSF